jgi:hypothetical protein
MNEPYFSLVDQQPTTLFLSGSCGFDRVYINQLQSGDRLVSYSPYYVHTGNGLLAGIDERFTRFDVVRSGLPIHTLTISWKTECETQMKPAPQIYTNGLPNLPVPIILMVVSLMYLAILRRIRH